MAKFFQGNMEGNCGFAIIEEAASFASAADAMACLVMADSVRIASLENAAMLVQVR